MDTSLPMPQLTYPVSWLVPRKNYGRKRSGQTTATVRMTVEVAQVTTATAVAAEVDGWLDGLSARAQRRACRLLDGEYRRLKQNIRRSRRWDRHLNGL